MFKSFLLHFCANYLLVISPSTKFSGSSIYSLPRLHQYLYSLRLLIFYMLYYIVFTFYLSFRVSIFQVKYNSVRIKYSRCFESYLDCQYTNNMFFLPHKHLHKKCTILSQLEAHFSLSYIVVSPEAVSATLVNTSSVLSLHLSIWSINCFSSYFYSIHLLSSKGKNCQNISFRFQNFTFCSFLL